MKNLNRITRIVVFICLILCSVGNARTLSSVEITAKNTSIRAGEPLVVKLTYQFEQPQIWDKTDKVLSSVVHNASFQVIKTGTEANNPINPLPIFPSVLTLQNSQGMEYSDYFVIFYDPFKKKPVFDEPGTYTLTVFGDTNTSDNLIITVVSASYLEKEALSLFTDPNTFFFLEVGSHESKDSREKSMIQLKKVVEQKPTTMLAKWSASRLGLEYFKEFHSKHPSLQKFKAGRRQVGTEEPILDQARLYLNKGVTLPSEFPIREEVLYCLFIVEYIDNDYQKGFSLLDELSTKYPTGKYGKKADRAKTELQELMNQELTNQ